MREILFRGKRVDNGEWVTGDGIHYPKSVKYKGTCWIDGMHEKANDWVQVIPETVGQYTGLTDTNVKKIFEGDIIRWAEKENYDCWLESLEHPELYDGKPYDCGLSVAVVKYCADNDYPAFEIVPNDFECNGLSELKGYCGDFTFEVIGNIHDNPELIGGTE